MFEIGYEAEYLLNNFSEFLEKQGVSLEIIQPEKALLAVLLYADCRE